MCEMVLAKLLEVIKSNNKIYSVLDSIQEGIIFSVAGQNVIEVETRRQPIEVSVSIKDNGSMPVCQGGLDEVAVTLTDYGFIIYINAVSDIVELNWTAYFEEE